MIKPRTPPGIMELLPRDQIAFQRMLDIIRRNYERFGFLPVETPVMELSEVLLTKSGGETERQVYFVQSTGALEKAAAGSDGTPELALRFDLTVPLARYVAEHEHDLTFPFRRYQMQRVYRGERAQRGRFREFYQCDIDVIGKDALSVRYDAEIPAVIHAVFSELAIGKFTIQLNNRKLLRGFFEAQGVVDGDLQARVLREVDKIDKRGPDYVRDTLIGPDQCVAHVVRTALVDLVHLAQHPRLQIAVDHPLSLEEPAQQLAVVELDGELADRQLGEHGMDHCRNLGVVAHRQRVLADHVDVALVELAEPAALRALAAVDPLHLIATERKRQIVLVLGDIARQRHGQVEAQRQLRRAIAARRRFFKRARRLDEVHLPLGLPARLGQQHLRQLHDRRLHRQKAETLVVAADDVEHPLEGNLVTGQQLHDPGRRTRLDQAGLQ